MIVGRVGEPDVIVRPESHARNDSDLRFVQQVVAQRQGAVDRLALPGFTVVMGDLRKGVKRALGSKTVHTLDGIEPLQSWSPMDRGAVRDPGLSVLLKQLARKNPGLCVVTSRERLTGLDDYEERSWLVQKNLEQISEETGRALLRVGGIPGTDAELEQITRDFGNHALAMSLLVAYLQETPEKGLAHARLIPALDNVPEEEEHPRRVMEAFVRRLGDGPELNVLHMMGLFDRLVTADEINYLRRGPALAALTDRLHDLPEASWRRVLCSLRQMRLLAPESHHSVGDTDAHPVVRQHFGSRLRAKHPESWREGHARLYEYYKALPHSEPPNTLVEMLPLYLALAHACEAGMYERALDEVYWPRIQRYPEAYGAHALGAYGTELEALAGFFEECWGRPVGSLSLISAGDVLTYAGYHLRASGRLREAREPVRSGLELAIGTGDWWNAAVRADNLSELQLIQGQIAEALSTARRGGALADRSGSERQVANLQALLADALHQAGALDEAKACFAKAEQMQARSEPEYPLLYAVKGLNYCDLLFTIGQHRQVAGRAMRSLQWSERAAPGPLFTGTEHLSLGCAQLLDAVTRECCDLDQASYHLDRAVEDFRAAAAQHYIPRGLLARAKLCRLRHDYSQAQRDLEDAFDIAIQSGMRLFECDLHLEWCRLILAMHEAAEWVSEEDFFPDSPLAMFGATKEPITAARKHLEKAAAMVREMGYHRRDPEVLIESAHQLIAEGNKAEAEMALEAAKRKVDGMGAHRWDRDIEQLRQRL